MEILLGQVLFILRSRRWVSFHKAVIIGYALWMKLDYGNTRGL
jgi:hypothetical protein